MSVSSNGDGLNNAFGRYPLELLLQLPACDKKTVMVISFCPFAANNGNVNKQPLRHHAPAFQLFLASAGSEVCLSHNVYSVRQMTVPATGTQFCQPVMNIASLCAFSIMDSW